MKNIVLILAFSITSLLGFAQCPTAPAFTSTNMGMGCTAGTWTPVGSVRDETGSPTAAPAGCIEFTGANTFSNYVMADPIDLSTGITCASMTFNLSKLQSDGVALSFVNFAPRGGDFPCAYLAQGPGGNIGYNAYNNTETGGGGALTIEVDAFQNTDDMFPADGTPDDDDPACDHVSIVEDGDNVTSLAQACISVTDAVNGDSIDNAQDHTLEVCYDASTNELTVKVNGTTLITYTNDIVTNYFGGTSSVNLAISSSTNGSFLGINRVCDFTVSCATTDIDLSWFKARNDKTHISLDWVTSKEIDNSHFEIERSQDGKTFKKIAKVEGVGNFTGKIAYNYHDKEPLIGLNYYRIKQVDIDGKHEYFQVEKVEYKFGDNISIKNHGSKVEVVGIDYEFGFEMYDISGKSISNSTKQDNNIINVKDLNNGIYYIVINSEKGSTVKKFYKN